MPLYVGEGALLGPGRLPSEGIAIVEPNEFGPVGGFGTAFIAAVGARRARGIATVATTSSVVVSL